MSDHNSRPLQDLLNRIHQITQETDHVSLEKILDVVGRRSFGPLLLVAGLITLMPIIGDIPGVPTLMAVFVVLVAGQMLFRQEHLWLPQWLLQQSVSRSQLETSLEWLLRPAEFIDGWLQPRLTVFTSETATYPIAISCLFIAAVMPIMEVIPFSANLAGAALTAFGLALIAYDGLLALFAFGFTALSFGVVGYSFL